MRRTLGLATLVAGAWAAVAVAAGGGPTPGNYFRAAGSDGRERHGPLPGADGRPGHHRGRDPCARRRLCCAGRTSGAPMGPAVAWDGSTGGLARNGRRLVLSRFLSDGSAGSRFVVLHPSTLRVRARMTLRGAFASNAVSPEARRGICSSTSAAPKAPATPCACST